jgi:MHS family alpha-ketoglutarate permease-like MFS transporter
MSAFIAEARPRAQTSPAAAPRAAVIGSILVACSGNVVEWFDFFAYAFTALYFAPVFFPSWMRTRSPRRKAAR